MHLRGFLAKLNSSSKLSAQVDALRLVYLIAFPFAVFQSYTCFIVDVYLRSNMVKSVDPETPASVSLGTETVIIQVPPDGRREGT